MKNITRSMDTYAWETLQCYVACEMKVTELYAE